MKNQKISRKIISYMDSVPEYTNKGIHTDFRDNSMMAEACVFNFSQTGELVNRLDKEYLSIHQDILRFKRRGLRNRSIHDYEGINSRS